MSNLERIGGRGRATPVTIGDGHFFPWLFCLASKGCIRRSNCFRQRPNSAMRGGLVHQSVAQPSRRSRLIIIIDHAAAPIIIPAPHAPSAQRLFPQPDVRCSHGPVNADLMHDVRCGLIVGDQSLDDGRVQCGQEFMPSRLVRLGFLGDRCTFIACWISRLIAIPIVSVDLLPTIDTLRGLEPLQCRDDRVDVHWLVYSDQR